MAVADTARLIASLELKDLFSKQIGNAEKSLGKFDKRLDQTQSRAYRAGQQIGHGIQNTARIIATAAVTIGTISAGVLAKGIAAASDLNETVSKVGVVFKNQAAGVLAFGKNSAAALGLSQQAALEATATYGNLIVSLGLVPAKAAPMSEALVKLAADLASFNNVDPEETLLALRSGLVGETEPLRRFGINLNEQTLKAEALKLGLVKLEKGQKNYTAVLTPAQKAQAAYALIMEQSKTAQGDFARTSGGLANQVRILKANFTDMLATIGSPVLPQVAKVFQRINALIKENQPQVAKLGDAVAGLFTDENLDKGVAFLKGAFDTFKAAAPLLEASAKATLSVVQAAVSLFRSLPGPIQGLAAGAFAINKLTGGLVTNIAGGLKDLFLKQRGGTPANPLFVSDVSGGGGAITGAAGQAGKASALSKVLNIVGKVALIGIAADVIAQLAGALADQSAQNRQTGQDQQAQAQAFAKAAKTEDLVRTLNLLNDQLDSVNKDPVTAIALGLDFDGVTSTLKADRAAIVAELNQQQAQATAQFRQTESLENRTGQVVKGVNELAGKIKDDTAITTATLRVVGVEMKGLANTLRKSNNATEIKHAITEALKLIGGGRGNAEATNNILSGLKAALKNTHDPVLQKELRAAIAKVEKVIPGREFVQRQINKADAILRSNESTGRKIRELQGIERAIRDRGLPTAANRIREMIDRAKAAQVAASLQSARAIEKKKLSVTIPLTNRITVSARDIVKTQTTFKLLGGVTQS